MLVPIVSPLIADGLAEHIVRFLRAAETVLALTETVRVCCIRAETCGEITFKREKYTTCGGFHYCKNRTGPPGINTSVPWKTLTPHTQKITELRLSHELVHVVDYYAGKPGDEVYETNMAIRERDMRKLILEAYRCQTPTVGTTTRKKTNRN